MSLSNQNKARVKNSCVFNSIQFYFASSTCIYLQSAHHVGTSRKIHFSAKAPSQINTFMIAKLHFCNHHAKQL
jgi:hypothetical protein